MGTYVNPGNASFMRISGPDYVDKSGLIALLNERIGGTESLVCISRPRRFGKTYSAKMLSAYYDCSCDSENLFCDKAIAETSDFHKHLNRYNVICFDVTTFTSGARTKRRPMSDVPEMIQRALWKDLTESGFEPEEGDELTDFLIRCVGQSGGKQFIFIIDEWDAVIREAKDDIQAQESYLDFLRGWFKNISFTDKTVAAAFITGILPIKKDGSQSAISDFHEFSMLEPGDFAEYFGFTQAETADICLKNGLSFETMKYWYDGYTVGDIPSIYNPYSVMEAVSKRKFKSYWKRTSIAEALMTYIDMDQNGLQEDVAAFISGQTIEIDTESFQNDFTTFTCKDDVLTLLIHLGYLTYEEEDNIGFARIPNEEIRIEFNKILRKAKHEKLIELVRQSDQLLADTLSGKAEAVAKAIQKVHESSFSPSFYHNEQSLRYTVKMAYISCIDQYAKVEELPTGHGISDTVFLPKKKSSLPALVIELKWNKTAEGAINQIKDRNYPGLPAELSGEVVLVGINYDEKTKEHTCRIEKM